MLRVGPVYDTIKNFIDRIFDVPKTFLDLAIQQLVNASQVTARGLNFRAYLSVLGDMPREWQLVVNSLLIGTVLIMSLLILRTLLRLYFAAKDGIKYW